MQSVIHHSLFLATPCTQNHNCCAVDTLHVFVMELNKSVQCNQECV